MASTKCGYIGPPPQLQFPPQPMPMPTQPFQQPQFQVSHPPAMEPPAVLRPRVSPPSKGMGIGQNKNPNIGLNMKNGIEIIQNPKNYDKLSENLRNISNMINSPPTDSVHTKTPPACAPQPAEPKKPDDAWGKKTEEELQKICGEHDKIVNVILEEEEEMIASHKQHVDEIMEMVKQEMQMLQEVDKPGSDVESYAAALDATLARKMEAIAALKEKLAGFRSHLQREKDLSRKFYDQQNEIGDVFDLNAPAKGRVPDEDTQMLTNGLDICMSN